jgi:hypothetical protein
MSEYTYCSKLLFSKKVKHRKLFYPLGFIRDYVISYVINIMIPLPILLFDFRLTKHIL